MMPQFRKKPVVIEALRWDPEDMQAAGHIIGWLMVHGVENSIGDGKTLDIPTLEGTMSATPGDWIIRGVAGEFYPCKPQVFEATYEPVDLIPVEG